MYTILTREGAVRAAAEMAAAGQDTKWLADEQSAYRNEIQAVTSLVWEAGMEPDEAVERVLNGE